MMSSILYGEIKENQLRCWSENKNPYDIWLRITELKNLEVGNFLK